MYIYIYNDKIFSPHGGISTNKYLNDENKI